MTSLSPIQHHDKHHSRLQRFTQYCELILITAARDLAILHRHGVQASLIVELSQQVERLRQMSPTSSAKQLPISRIRKQCEELLLGIGKICRLVRRLKDPSLRQANYDRFLLTFDYWWENMCMDQNAVDN